jgi:RHS repeat-associated protein
MGYGSSLRALGAVAPQVRGERVVYPNNGLSEWYANRPLGLEQGFTVMKAPVGRRVGPLTLSIAVPGSMRSSLVGGGQGVVFRGAGGRSLAYGGLVARDGRGRLLHSWMELRGGLVLLRVDAHGARFPLRLDPLVQEGSKMTGGEEVGQGLAGYAVALSGDGNTAVVGGYGDNELVGAVWIFTRSGNTWTQQGPKLTGKEEVGEGQFGEQVAISGDGKTVMVGARFDNSQAGAVWVFVRSGTTWTQQGPKIAGEGAFGLSISLSANGNTALVNGATLQVLSRSEEGKWSMQTIPVGEAYEVALSAEGTTALIGRPLAFSREGAAVVYTLSQGKWSQQGSEFRPKGEETGDGGFGARVALSADGGRALISAPEDGGGVGAAWVFYRTEAGEWKAQSRKITASGEIEEGHFGSSVSLSADGNTALIGGDYDHKGDGAAWLFVDPAEESYLWSQDGAKLTSGEGHVETHFGISVALSASGETALVGGSSDSVNKGAAWGSLNSFSPEELYGPENESEPNIHRPCAGGPVNCATGNQFETQTDLTAGGRGAGLRLTRTYNSQLAAHEAAVYSERPPFGYGWTGPYSAHIEVPKTCSFKYYCAEHLTVYQSNASVVTFRRDFQGKWSAAPSVESTVTEEGGNYRFTLPDQTLQTFNSAGQLISETDRNGNTIKLTYWPENESLIESVSDSDGHKLTYTYNEEGCVGSVKDSDGNTVKYTYESGTLKSVTEPGESSPRWQFEYDSSHQMTTETDGRSHTLTTEYNSSHQVIAQTDPMERKRKWSYFKTETGSETTITEPNGSTTVEQFNAALLPKSITHAHGTALAATTTYEYNGALDLTSVTDPDKHITTYTYDGAGDRTSATDANGNQTKWTYNGAHEVESITTPKGEKTTIKLDSHGNPLVIESPAPGGKTQKTTYKYDSDGDLLSETDSLGRERTYGYDAMGDRESETDPEGDKRTWKYNGDSQEIAMTSPRGNAKGVEPSRYTTKIERDDQGRPVTVTDPLGHTTKYTYDGNGNLETLTDGNGHKTTYTYDADNEPTKIEEPNGATTETGYDSAGQVTSQTDGNKHTTKYVRNPLEEVTEIIDPLSRTTTKEYDAAGNLTKLTDPKKRTTTYTYDPANRLTQISYSDGKTSQVKYEYDKDGDRTGMSDGTGKSTYTFDQLDRLTHTTNGHGESVGFEYDLDNEQTKLTYPNKNLVTRGYDNAGRLLTVTDWLGHQTKLTYDPDSNVTAITFPSGTNNQDKYAYNEADQMSEARMAKGTETLASLAYSRDNDGQLKKTTSKGLPGEEALEYAYDENSRLTKGAGTGYEYDAANNPTKIAANTYTYDNADELETGAGFKYAYNEVGQRAKATPSGSATTYGYDQAGNLTTLERPVEGKTPQIKDTYAYDGNGLRASQTVSGTTTYMAWNPTEGTPQLLGDGTNSYIYGPESLPVEQINTSQGKVLYLHHDQQGSTRLLTGSTGATEGSMTYDAYGNTTATKGASTTPLGYDGQYTNSDTGLIYLRARVYDPTTAQFTSRDPLVALTEAPYFYAEDNPLSFGDPTGAGFLSWIENTASTVACSLGPEACAYEQLPVAIVKVVYNDADAILEPCRAVEDREKSLADVASAAVTTAFSAVLPKAETTIPEEGLSLLKEAGAGRAAIHQLNVLSGAASTATGVLTSEQFRPAHESSCECDKE